MAFFLLLKLVVQVGPHFDFDIYFICVGLDLSRLSLEHGSCVSCSDDPVPILWHSVMSLLINMISPHLLLCKDLLYPLEDTTHRSYHLMFNLLAIFLIIYLLYSI